MNKQEVFRLPTIEFENKEDLIAFFSENLPDCIFEYAEEVSNPVGKQWNYTLTAKVVSDDFGTVIVKFEEPLWKKPDNKSIIAVWLKEAIPEITCWFRGKIKP